MSVYILENSNNINTNVSTNFLTESKQQFTKVAINCCYGGFGLSDEAYKMYVELKSKTNTNGVSNEEDDELDFNRTDQLLIQVIEELGQKANGFCSKICLVEIPIGTKYRITEYDGFEGIQIEKDIRWKTASSRTSEQFVSVAINGCFGGFSLSDEGKQRYFELKREKNSNIDYDVCDNDCDYDMDRSDPVLIQVIQELGQKANGLCAKICIEQLPVGTRYRITEYDGNESIQTEDSICWNVA